MAFPVLDKPEAEGYAGLNDAQKQEIVDAYVAGETATGIKHSKDIALADSGKYVPLWVAKDAISKIKGIYKECCSLMQSESVPADLASLKKEAIKAFPECSQAGFDYTVDKIIENCTVAGTFDSFKAYFDSLPMEA